jgi:primase-polymerase (primpol)-like protein
MTTHESEVKDMASNPPEITPETAINWYDFPGELKHVDQWVCWRYIERGDDKSGKLPINPNNGEPADVTDPACFQPHCLACIHHNYGTVEEYGKYTESPTDGLGFVFTTDDSYVGIDLDDCVDMLGIDPWALRIIDEVDSYTEYSPSGTGLHIILKGVLPSGNVRRGNVEMYECDRYFTVTGRHVPFTPSEVMSDNGALESIHNAFIATDSDDDRNDHDEQQITTGGGDKPAAARSDECPDDELLSKAKQARNSEKFTRLWNGDTTGYPSRSEADQALCNYLAFWTAHNSGQMDRLFRRSGLMRAKWDEQRGSRTYGELTISAALRTVDNDYSPDYRNNQDSN